MTIKYDSTIYYKTSVLLLLKVSIYGDVSAKLRLGME